MCPGVLLAQVARSHDTVSVQHGRLTNQLAVSWQTDKLAVTWQTDKLALTWQTDNLAVTWQTDNLAVTWQTDKPTGCDMQQVR